MPRTMSGQHVATVKESADGFPFILFEPSGDAPPELSDFLLCLRLKPGATYEDAQAVARYINGNIDGLSLTDMRVLRHAV